MAKAAKVYQGCDSYGRTIQVAERGDGQWFWREWGWNGFGVAWSKWCKADRPIHPTTVRNMAEYADAPEYVEVPECERLNRVEWGFNVLRALAGPYKLRLPDNA